MATTRKADFSTAATSISVTNLNSLATVSGWLSPKITLVSSNLSQDKVIVYYQISVATSATAGTTVEFYLARTDNNASPTFIDGGFSTFDTTTMPFLDHSSGTRFTAAQIRDQLQLVNTVPVLNAAQTIIYEGSFVIIDPGPYFSLFVYNGTNVSINGSNNAITVQPVQDNYA